MANTSYNTLHAHYLTAMGIQVWIRRHLTPELKNDSALLTESAIMPADVQAISEEARTVNTGKPQIAQSVTATPLTQNMAKTGPTTEIDIANTSQPRIENVPQPNIAQTPQSLITSAASVPIPANNLALEREDPKKSWEALRNRVAICTACELHQNRTQAVFGIGNLQANLMLIGEAPGADEDAVGEPFVGRAGQLLNAMLRAIDFKREEVYIANMVKCRPPGNRNPKLEEMVCCHGFLQHQISLIKPKLIVAVGRIAAQHILKTNQAISKIRGQQFEYGEAKIPLIPIFHPAYLLRSPSKKRESWQDLQIIRRAINGILGT